MWIKKLELENVGPFFGKHEFTFERGSVAIVGPNGAGKSSLVDFIYAGLTNDFGRFAGVTADCINNRLDKDDRKARAGIHQVWEHDGRVITIRRTLKPSGYELRCGQEVFTKSADGLDYLRSIGVDRKVIDFAVFKRQPGSDDGAIDDFLKLTPAARAAVFQVLNQTGDCEVAYNEFGAFISEKQPPATNDDDSDELVAAVGQFEAQIEALVEARGVAKGRLLSPEHLAKAKQIVANAEKFEAVAEKVEQARNKLTDRKVDVKEAKRALEHAEGVAADGAKKSKEAVAVEERAKAGLAAIDELERYDAAEKEAEANAFRHAKAGTPPEPPADASEDLERRASLLDADIKAAEKVVKLFDEKGLTECPTCGTEVAAFEAKVEAARKLVEEGPKRSADLWAKAAELADYGSRLVKFEREEAVRKSKLKAAKEVYAALVEPENATATRKLNRAKLKEEYEDAFGVRVLFDSAVKRVGKAKAALATAKARFQDAAEHLTALEAEQTACSANLDKVDAVRARLAEHDEARVEMSRYDGELAQVRPQLAAAKERLARLRTKAARLTRATKAIKVLTKVRDALHKQALPQLVAEANLVRMEEDLNEGLAMFGSPFWVEARGLTFTVHKPGEPPHPAERLSGGQRVVLAIPFWSALNSLYKSGVGTLVLDEPTANLDDANVAYLRESLSRLTQQIRGNRQLIIITHADELRGACDQVVDLGG